MLNHRENGNALFLILIAVALFAALSYAVTQSGRGGGGIDRETAALSASQLVQYGALAETAINRMRIASGCANNEFSFERAPFDGTDAAYVNAAANARGDFACHFYHPNGGAMIEFDASSAAGLSTGSPEVEFYGSARILGAGTGELISSTTDDETEITLFVRNMTEEACTQIVQEAGLNTIPADSGNLDVAPFTGTFTFIDNVHGCLDSGCSGDANNSPFFVNNTRNACFIEASSGPSGDFIYFHVLLAR